MLAAIFLYNLTVAAGQFDIVKHSVASLSDDRRIQALLIAFSFGAFVEGAAGFGTPVAISAALMLGAGFKPLYAAGLALLANTSPVAFGALGTPIITLAQITGIDEHILSAMAGRQLPFFSLIIPVWLVWVMSGWRGVLGVWPALVVCGGSFALVQFRVANYHGPSLVDVAGGLVSLISLSLVPALLATQDQLALRRRSSSPAARSHRHGPLYWQAGFFRLDALGAPDHSCLFMGIAAGQTHARRGQQSSESRLQGQRRESIGSQFGLVMVKVPALHRQIARGAEVVEKPEPEDAIYECNWLSASGTAIFITAILSAIWLRVGIGQFVRIFVVTCHKMGWPLFTIACMLAIAYTTRYSGMDATLGLAFTRTGVLYPMFAALLGWLGVALTGSDTSSNALFGGLQTITATRLVNDGVLPLSIDQAKILLATANSTGGVMGKMIDAQSIVVAAAATDQDGNEGPILRFVFWHSLILAILMGGLVLFQAYVWTSAIPVAK